jgi:gamma-glutamylcyclotransferase (GGCT)/AIG2-like uncharacterized protein YtfP
MPFTDADFAIWPYPGARPRCSFVHIDGTGWPLRATPGTGWRWALADTGADLDDWLAAYGAAPLSARIPLLAYGSNANPAKMTWLRDTFGLPGPVVVLRVVCTGLAAVWAVAPRVVDTQRPATLIAEPGRVEWHAVWLATREQIRVLDVCEGRDVRYRLVRLDSGTVTGEDGVVLPEVLAYTGAGEARAPLLVDGAAVRCDDLAQATAVGLVGRAGTDGLMVRPVVGEPSPGDWPGRLFVYGTLRPGESAWHLLRPYVSGKPVATRLTGALFDTGRGYPAFCAGDGDVPGWTVALRSPAVALAELDIYEGAEYRRVRAVDSTGRLCWTYLWSVPTEGMRSLRNGWPAAD